MMENKSKKRLTPRLGRLTPQALELLDIMRSVADRSLDAYNRKQASGVVPEACMILTLT